MTSHEITRINHYLNEDNYVVVYVLDDENYEVISIDNKWTSLDGWMPDKLTDSLDSKNIVVYKNMKNWRLEL